MDPDLSVPPDVAARALRAQGPMVASAAPDIEGQRAAAQALRQPDLDQIYDHPPPEPKPLGERRWTPLDIGLQAAMAGVSAYDAYDTNQFLRANPDGIEENPLLGHRPGGSKLALATAVGQLAHLGISEALPHGWPRTLWQALTLAQEASVVASNHGVKPFDKFWGWAMNNGGADKRRR